MELSLIIPVWNDRTGLERLLAQAAQLGLWHEVIVSDDASDEPVGPDTVHVPPSLAARVIWLRADEQRGAGHARNAAMERVTGSHVIFFDSDDLFAEDFPSVAWLAAAQTEPFDFLIFRHDDSRVLADGRQGAFQAEENYWQAVQAEPDPKVLTPTQARILCNLSAYPWNKIYRTGFLRENGIRCTEIMVHNDVELHWTSFILAKRILASSRVGATHFVVDGGARLTNRRSADRLAVFRSFQAVMSRLQDKPDADRLAFLVQFTRFTWKLLKWIRHSMDEAYQSQLQAGARHFFAGNFNRPAMTLVAYADPGLARAINRLILQGELP